MSFLKHKTRGNSAPQGKPRVYFCCHPKDFVRCFESVTDEILAKQNCVIWYNDTPTTHDEDFLSNLLQMQLFVMPVTTNLLCTKNDALDIEFKFAVEHHIPVLPLMQEPGLEELFNTKCGDLQFLDKNNTDATAISYDEKLQKYLESILIGDELADKIRMAFDAYVFLSYRKKDRKYAQELMRLIHKNDFCRDIAIWYDEFLTPGEDFNDSIKEALRKSGLFVMTVTPNLINEPNYIMTTEYPMAKQEGKLILPAEFVPTDRALLSEKYEDLPHPTDARSESELSEALLASVKRMAIRENDNSPEHNFFIGLAYLGGIDVEVDYDRAISLITSASDSGLTEATQKLVSIYQNGTGVTADLNKAVEYQTKLVDQCNSIFNKSNKEEDFHALLDAIIICGELYSKLGLHEDARQEYAYALQLCRKAATQFNSAYAEYGIYVCRSGLGDALLALGRLEPAIDHYLEGIEVLLLLQLKTDMVGLKEELCNAYHRVGSAYEKLHRFEEALEYYNDALEIADKEQDFEAICEATMLIASVYMAQGNIYEALNRYEKARAYYEHLAEQTRSDSHYYNLSVAYSRMAQLFEMSRQPDQARRMYLFSIEIREGLVQRTNGLAAKTALANNYSDIAIVFSMLNKHNEALEWMQKSAEIREELSDQCNSFEMKREASATYNNMANILVSMGQLNTAIDLFLRSIRIREELVEATQSLQYKLDLCEAYDNLGTLYRILKRRDEAMDLFQKSVRIVDNLSSEQDDRFVLYQRACSQLNLGLLNEDYESLEQAYRGFRHLSQAYPSVSDYARKRELTYKKMSALATAHAPAPESTSLFSRIKNIFKK